jgi:tape measure domain-containing protein
MARRVIATAEVQVAANVGQAEAGLNGLTETFRQIGRTAERAAERAEAAFFGTARSINGGYKQIIASSNDLLVKMEQTDRQAKLMAESFREALTAVKRMANEDMDAKAIAALRVFKEIAGAAEAIDAGLHDATATAARLTREAQEVEGAIRAAEIRTDMLGQAFRDVGQDIDVAMAGGLENIQDDIRDTIRRLEDLGGEFRDVGRIGEAALDGVLNEFDADVNQATAALMRLERQLYDVAQIGDKALEGLDDDARQAAAAMSQMAIAANRADRSIDGIGNVARRTSGDVRGLVGLLGAAGLGFAAASAARAGLDMTLQLEKSEAMFLGLTGSVEGAADMLERMVIFARETPYNLANVSDAAAQLLAVGDGFGVTSKNIEQYLTAFGDAITMTGGGDEQFTRLVRVFGQMSSSGKVLGQDMNQLAQNLPGYDVWQALADGAGTSVKELRRLQDLGQLDNLLTGNQAVEILIDGMKQIPGAAGAMERRMLTLGGAIEKFRETAQFAISEGLIPFSDTAQDVLSDPVILNSVEDLSNGFGALLSGALQDVRPELDDLAAAGENLIAALESWSPVLTQITDSLGDFLNFVSPLVSGLGKATEAVLGFGDGLGKLGVAAALFAAGGPIGIAGGVLFGVSGAMDLFTQSNEDAANMARLLAAAQGEVNDAMAIGEEVVYSEAQQLAIDSANELRNKYGELANAMALYGVSINDLQSGLSALAGGVGEVTPELQRMLDNFRDPDVAGDKVIGQFEAIAEAYKNETDVLTEETAKQQDVLTIAGVEEIAALEERADRQRAYNEEVAAYWEEYGDNYQAMIDAQSVANDGWGELDEERTDAVRSMLQDQADAYVEWEADINESTSAAELSLSSVAEEAENSARRIIDAINENSAETFAWKNNIVTAASQLADAYGVPDEAAQEFMGTLGELGPAAAPALQEMLDDFANGGTLLKEFFDSTQVNAAVMSSSLTDEFDKVTGAAPGLAEGLAEGTLTIEQILAELPAAMAAAGLDLEAAAAQIDIADDMETVGGQGVAGLVNALSSAAALARVKAASASLASASINAVQRTFDTGSPSRVMYDIGEFVVEGLVGGIQDMSDEAYITAVQTASLVSGGIANHFRDAENPREAAREFAEDVASAIVDELIAEQEAVADAAEALAEAAADRLAEAWDRVKDRFLERDLKESIVGAQAELSEALAELRSAESLAGAGGTAALSAAEDRVAKARAVLAEAEAADEAADRIADNTLTAFQRGTEDAVAALQDQQESEVSGIEARIAAATRNLDPVARAVAEAELAAAKERHEAEMTALDRQREDEEDLLRRRLDAENEVREAAVKAKEDELDAFQDALDDVVDSIRDAIENLPDLRAGVEGAQRDVQDAYLDQFERMLENASSVDRNLLASIGTQSGLTAAEVNDLINAAVASESAGRGAAAANLGVEQLLNVLGSGLYTIGANGALGIAAGISSQARAIAEAMFGSVQTAIQWTLAGLEIRSPSGVTERMIGEPLAQGIAKGLTASLPEVGSAMTGLIDNVIGGVKVPTSSQLVGESSQQQMAMGGLRGPLITMPGAIIQDATDADVVAQRLVVALSATGYD